MPNLIKKGLRQAFLERRQALSKTDRIQADAQIVDRLSALPEYRQAKIIALYLPLPEEVDVRPLVESAMAAGKRVMLPRVNHKPNGLDFCFFDGTETNLAKGPYGILEPVGPAESVANLDLVVVPGLAFDLHGHRLGYGAGYYDRFLKTIESATIGVAYDVLTIDILPVAEHDVAMDKIVTETRTIEWSDGGDGRT